MATPVRTSMRTRRSKRPASPVEEKRKKKVELPVTSDAPVDVVTVTPEDTTESLMKPKPTTPGTRQSAIVSRDKQKVILEPTPTDTQPSAPEQVVTRLASVDPTAAPAAAPAPIAPAPTVVAPAAAAAQPEYKGHCFKDPNFVHSSKGGSTAGKKSRVWKTLKQIAAAERSLPWKPGDPTYSSLEAPPSFKPAKKYSDLSGFQAKYTDPHTKLRYATTEEFSRLRMLPQDIVTGLLSLRKANTEVP